MPRFFVEQPLAGEFLLDGEAGRHGAKVLRLRPGEAVTLCDRSEERRVGKEC